VENDIIDSFGRKLELIKKGAPIALDRDPHLFCALLILIV